MVRVERFVREHEGCVDPRLFSDEEVYREEMERIFRRTWLYVGHESQIPQPGDYLLNYMGEDEVILVRDTEGKIRVFLNRCAHRGNKVCLYDRGNRKVFTCTFHGWSYDTHGRLVGQAFREQAYAGTFDRGAWGLIEIPRVEQYGGLIFASWDERILPLPDYLGDLRFYLDLLVVKPYLGGIEVIPGRGRYMIPINWKAMAENFMSDDYHVATTHASFFRASLESGLTWWGGELLDDEIAVQVLVLSPAGAPHALGDVGFWGDPRPHSPFQVQLHLDREIARELGPEAVQWVEERHRRMRAFIEQGAPRVFGAANWTIFPNFSLLTGYSAFRGLSLIQWHPRGPFMVEAWQWCAVEREAPEIVKRTAMIFQASDQAPAGMITIDDMANFERATEVIRATRWHEEEYPLNFQSSGDRERIVKALRDVGLDPESLPGTVLPLLTEETARAYYRFYKALMEADPRL